MPYSNCLWDVPWERLWDLQNYPWDIIFPMARPMGRPTQKGAVYHSNGPGDAPWDVKAHGTSTIPWDATTGCSHSMGSTYPIGRPIGSYRTAYGILVAMGRPMEQVTGFSRPTGRPPQESN